MTEVGGDCGLMAIRPTKGDAFTVVGGLLSAKGVA
jgi:hypothetical protein